MPILVIHNEAISISQSAMPSLGPRLTAQQAAILNKIFLIRLLTNLNNYLLQTKEQLSAPELEAIVSDLESKTNLETNNVANEAMEIAKALLAKQFLKKNLPLPSDIEQQAQELIEDMPNLWLIAQDRMEIRRKVAAEMAIGLGIK